MRQLDSRGLGGLLFGVDVDLIVAAVLLGDVISTLLAGARADLPGRKTMMILSGLLFVVSVPAIALAEAHGAPTSTRDWDDFKTRTELSEKRLNLMGVDYWSLAKPD